MDAVSWLMLGLMGLYLALILRWFKTDDRFGRPSEKYTGARHLYHIYR